MCVCHLQASDDLPQRQSTLRAPDEGGSRQTEHFIQIRFFQSIESYRPEPWRGEGDKKIKKKEEEEEDRDEEDVRGERGRGDENCLEYDMWEKGEVRGGGGVVSNAPHTGTSVGKNIQFHTGTRNCGQFTFGMWLGKGLMSKATIMTCRVNGWKDGQMDGGKERKRRL